MNISCTLEIYGGGPGSGCRGPGCGRPRLSAPHDTSKVVSVDFDNTIATHTPGHYELGTPLPNGLKLLHALKQKGYTVHIFTARPNIPEVQSWLDKHGAGFAKATNQKIPSAAYVDDRAVQWTGDRSVEEAMQKIDSLSQLRDSQVKEGMRRLAEVED